MMSHNLGNITFLPPVSRDKASNNNNNCNNLAVNEHKFRKKMAIVTVTVIPEESVVGGLMRNIT
jgi:hypothetical protein